MLLRAILPVLAVLTLVAGCGGEDGKTTTTRAAGVAGAPATSGGGSDGNPDVQRQFVDTVQQLSPSVVQIQTGNALGSGVVYDDQGNIVTNAHVVGNSKTFTVTLHRGDQHDATLVGTYPPNDLAVIKLKDGSAPKAAFGDSGKLQVGDLVLAIGNPLGLRSSVTDGIISSLGRTVGEGNGAVIPAAVQTSAPINPGNSGGALVDLDRQVVGIPTLAATNPELGGAQAPGIGFAIPSNTVKRIADQLIANGKVLHSGRAYLGVEVASRIAEPSVVVAGVEKGGPADKAGIKPGDTIVSIDGKPVRSTDDVATILAEHKPGDTVPVEVRHADGSKATLQVKLGEARG
jgi:putative serine protease PepD